MDMNLYRYDDDQQSDSHGHYLEVVSVCVTCNGTGDYINMPPWASIAGMQSSCPDCVGGRVTQQGTIRRWCSVHDAQEIVDEFGYNAPGIRTCRWGLGQGACKFGLVLVVPLEETT